jgi:hypothetical protein
MKLNDPHQLHFLGVNWVAISSSRKVSFSLIISGYRVSASILTTALGVKKTAASLNTVEVDESFLIWHPENC